MATTDFNTRLGQAILQLGSSGFYVALDAALSSLARTDYPQYWLFRRGEAPRSLYHTLRGKLRKLHVEAYIAGAYRDDPVYRKSLEADTPNVFRITEITAARFRQTEYYRRFHGPTGNIDEVTFVIKLDEDHTIHLPMMRVQGSGRFSDTEIEQLRAIEPLVRALVVKHWQLDSASEPEPQATSQAIDHFGRAILTPREFEVTRLLLLGHNNKTAAERLEVSPETLRRHRQAIYRKLDIGSLAELFSLFIACLPRYERSPGEDPLVGYLVPGPDLHAVTD